MANHHLLLERYSDQDRMDLGFRLGKNTLPMKTCDLCSRLNIDVLLKDDYQRDEIKHQTGFTALKTSASMGCEMCSMFLNAAPELYCSEKHCSAIVAHQAFQKSGISRRRDVFDSE